MNSKKLKFGGLALAAFVAAMGLSACAGENGADGQPGKDGVDGIAGEDGVDGKEGSSCTATALKDDSGYVLSCGGEVVGTILNGKDGVQGIAGADGKSCSAAPNADASGYDISCDGKVVGSILNGAAGESCTAKPMVDEMGVADGRGFILTCGGEEIGTILNGTNGTSCNVNPLEDGSGVIVTCSDADGVIIKNGINGTNCLAEPVADEEGSYTLTCDGEVVGTISNGKDGEKGNDGSALDALGLMMAASGSMKEYVGDKLGSVAYDEKGSGAMETWNGADQKERVITGLDDGTNLSGYWWPYSDEMSDDPDVVLGNTKVTFPAERPASGSMSGVIAVCNGVCASIELGDNADESYVPYAGLGFNITGSEGVGGNVKDWNGVCIAYTAGASEGMEFTLRLGIQDEKIVNGYGNFQYKLPSSNNAIVNIPWSMFKQPSWVTGAGVSTIAKTYAALASIKIEATGVRGATGFINIQKVGMYGHCGDVVEAPNPYEGIPQYEFVAGTNVLKPAKIADADKGTGVSTWNHEALPYNNVVRLAGDDENRYWYFFTDEVDLNGGEGTTEFTFPAKIDEWGGLTKIIEHCEGICGTVTMGDWSGVPQEYEHYAVIGFDVKTSEDNGNVAKDIRDWRGVCLTYSATGDANIYLEMQAKHPELIDYDNLQKILPKASSPITVNLAWEDLAQGGWGDHVSLNELLAEMKSVRVYFKGNTGEKVEFNIMQLGAYGNCQ